VSINLFLVGKKYTDIIFYMTALRINETNDCKEVVRKNGGMFNILDSNTENTSIVFLHRGEKEAHIISDKSTSKRTSIVRNISNAILTKEDIEEINSAADWVHVSYLDDFEDLENLKNIEKPISIDFCTIKERDQFYNFIDNVDIIFDSRERKYLYNNLSIDAPIIFHDEFGIEIVKNNEIVFKDNISPLENIDVNGAGDIYAFYFIKNYYSLGLFKSATAAMKETTKTLLHRGKNEKKV
jgi:hypothetical protein